VIAEALKFAYCSPKLFCFFNRLPHPSYILVTPVQICYSSLRLVKASQFSSSFMCLYRDNIFSYTFLISIFSYLIYQ
jgi:hypothetical protein